MRVLIYMPLAPITPRVYARSLQSVLTVEWGLPIDVVLGREDMDGQPNQIMGYQNITDKYNRARDMALRGGYDALLTVESDMIIPPNALTRLCAVDADVAYGLYVSRHGQNRWLAFPYIDDQGYGVSLADDLLNAQAAWGCVVETHGVGLGCTLIHRRVLEQIEFRCPNARLACDWYFALDCRAAGFHQAHDCAVVCGHISGSGAPKIYWPDETGGVRVEFLPEAPPDRVKVTDGYTFSLDRLGSVALVGHSVEGAA
jgi:hypothetical protein